MAVQVPEARTFGGLIREIARNSPDSPAILYRDQCITFAELDRWVDDVARGLLALGVSHGDMVAVWAGNRPDWLAVALGAARIGAPVAPLNTWYRPDEVRYQLGHADVRVLFVASGLRNRDFLGDIASVVPEILRPEPDLSAPEFPHLKHIVELDSPITHPGTLGLDHVVELGQSSTSEDELRRAEERTTEDDLLFILYTSGSTAKPKGVQLHHGLAIENAFNIGERQRLDDTDRVWLGTPLFYAFASVNAVPVAWTHAAALVLQEAFEAGEALATIERHRATAYYGLGNITRALVEHEQFSTADVSSLEKGVVGFSAAEKQLTIDTLGVRRVCSMYGMSEAYGHCAVTDADDDLDVKLHTQGLPLPGWTLKVLDQESGVVLPAGQVGELRVRGFVTSGYYKDPELTRATFDEDGFFKTGDLAQIDEDGRLRFHSRIKEVIKSGGINISPLEVEGLLESHPAVRQAHVVGVPDAERGEIVVAFVEAAPPADDEALKRHVAAAAASFKVPRHIFMRRDDEFPRVATGKVPKYELVAEARRLLHQAP